MGSEIECNKEEKNKIEHDKGAVGCKMKSGEWECSKCSNGLINRRLVRGSVIKGKWSNRECNNKGEWINTNAECIIQNMEQGIK